MTQLSQLFHQPKVTYNRAMPIEPISERLFSVKDAAELLGLGEQAVRNLCQRGRIKAQKLGNAWLIPESSLNDFEPRKRGDRITKR